MQNTWYVFNKGADLTSWNIFSARRIWAMPHKTANRNVFIADVKDPNMNVYICFRHKSFIEEIVLVTGFINAPLNMEGVDDSTVLDYSRWFAYVLVIDGTMPILASRQLHVRLYPQPNTIRPLNVYSTDLGLRKINQIKKISQQYTHFDLTDQQEESTSRTPSNKLNTSGWVYIIQMGYLPFIKIGIATDWKSRLSNLQTGSPLRLKMLSCVFFEQGKYDIEKELHVIFKDYRETGEWFRIQAIEEEVTILSNLPRDAPAQALKFLKELEDR